MPLPSPATGVRVRTVDAFLRRVPTRFPFRFGNAVMADFELLYVRVRIEATGGRAALGVSASVLSPMWFDKRDRGLDERRDDLLTSVRLARTAALDAEPDSGAGLHRAIEAAVLATPTGAALPRLTAGFGVALLDSAVTDALCRLLDCTLHQALRDDVLGCGPLPGLPPAPLPRLHVRHTVGLGDPLNGGTLDDGLPHALADVCATYGHRWFKLKIGGDPDAACARLRDIATVLERAAPDCRLTVDGNEQLPDVEHCAALWTAVQKDPLTAALWERVAWVEQPLDRHADAIDGGRLRAAFGGTPVILDEADDDDDAVVRALQSGYDGISAKNCKGFYRTLHSFSAVQNAHAAGQRAILSSEDLTNPPAVALQQDCAVAAALGIEHTERNAHHYVRGIGFLDRDEQRAITDAAPRLYGPLPDGTISLRIDAGAIDVRDLNATGYGACPLPDWSTMQSIEP